MPDNEDQKALSRALRLLGYRPRSVKEIRVKLTSKGFSADSIDSAITRLTDMGYLDEKDTARYLADKAQRVKHLGARGAKSYLRGLGVPEPETKEALVDYDEAETAHRLMERKLRALKGYPKDVLRRRLTGYLQRRGYSAEVVRRALKDALK